MPARIIRPPCTRYQSECRLTVWRIASRIAWAAASSDMVMVRLHSTNVHRKIPRRESAVLATLTRQMMTGVTLFSVQGKSFPSVALRLGAVLSGVRRPLVHGHREQADAGRLTTLLPISTQRSGSFSLEPRTMSRPSSFVLSRWPERQILFSGSFGERWLNGDG